MEQENLWKNLGDEDGKNAFWKEHKWKWFVTFFIGNVMISSSRVVISITMPALSEELGWDKQISGTALAAFFCGYICTNIIGGHAADRVGGERVICYAGVGWVLLTLLLPFIAHMEILWLTPTVAVIMARFVTGLSQGAFYPSLASITVRRISPSEKGFFTGFVNSGISIGCALTGFFGSMILEAVGWQYVFFAVGLLSILWILWLRYMILCCEDRWLGEPSRLSGMENIPWRVLATKPPFWALFVAYFTAHYSYFTLLSWAPVYFNDTYPNGRKSLFNTIPYLVEFVLANVCGYIGSVLTSKNFSNTFIRKLFASFNLLGISGASFLLVYVKNFDQALFIMSMAIGSHAFRLCSINLNAQDLAPRHAGALHGFVNGSGALAGILGNYLSGCILKAFNQWYLVFVVNSFSCLFGFLCFMLFGYGEPVI